jgi:hypothetical protein
MMNSNTDSEYTDSAYGASSNSGSSEEQRKYPKHEHKKTKKPKSCRKKKKAKNKDDEPKKNTCPPTARNTIAGSPIVLNWTNACRTRSIRDAASSQSAMSLKKSSSHASNLRWTWVGMRRRKILSETQFISIVTIRFQQLLLQRPLQPCNHFCKM